LTEAATSHRSYQPAERNWPSSVESGSDKEVTAV
jgi:hypothetical protein